MFTPEQWHAHFCYQANWTEQVRQHFFKDNNNPNNKILEVGCGTGAIIGSTFFSKYKNLVGLDCSFKFLDYCSKLNTQIDLACGDAYHLPFCDAVFEITYCHFLLLWLKKPLEALKEFTRVTHKNGWVAAFAEPDHEARIDYPHSFGEMGKAQALSLVKQGVNLQCGRQLCSLMLDAGLRNVEVGIIGANWKVDQVSNHAKESEILSYDLEWLTGEEKEELKTEISSENEVRKMVVFVPTFYAWGQV